MSDWRAHVGQARGAQALRRHALSGGPAVCQLQPVANGREKRRATVVARARQLPPAGGNRVARWFLSLDVLCVDRRSAAPDQRRACARHRVHVGKPSPRRNLPADDHAARSRRGPGGRVGRPVPGALGDGGRLR